MSQAIGLAIQIEAREQLHDLRMLARRSRTRYHWKIKWATSRRAWRNRPRERAFLEIPREVLDNALQVARNPKLYRSEIDWRAIEHTFHPKNQYRDPHERRP